MALGMQESEFDQFAEEYKEMHTRNIAVSGEGPDYFAARKIRDLAAYLGPRAHHRLRVLDFGAGVGTSIPWFSALMPGAELTCADVSRKSLELGRRLHGDHTRFIHFDGERLPFVPGDFDVAFAACVFHHIPAAEHGRLLRELRRVLAPGGVLLIYEHNPLNPLTVRAVNQCPFDANAVLIPSGTLLDALRQAGFSDCIRRYRIFFPHFARALRPLESWLTWLPLGAQYYVAGHNRART